MPAPDDLYLFLQGLNGSFTEEMWNGNAPSARGHKNVSGGYNDLWQTRYGGGETYNDQICFFTFSLSPKVSIFICGDYLRITEIRYAGKFDMWVCQNKDAIPFRQNGNDHVLEEDKVRKYLNTKIENCRIWELVRARAAELLPQKYEKL